ncbi:endonuclease domain-containing protein [Streptomyces sp. NPDC048723]|uniref:endonuclease domain-containing protein n=1 Tax=Streptomyces sp. NPDC048723 TaxID=3365589 RepID=UPI003713892C
MNRRDRCPFGGASWPPPPARTRSIRILRETLIAAYGPDCQLCGLYPGEMVDHDHETGYVRGMLCRFCNCTLEECPHIAGCPKADFMNNPPAKSRDARLRPVRRAAPPGPPRPQTHLDRERARPGTRRTQRLHTSRRPATVGQGHRHT